MSEHNSDNGIARLLTSISYFAAVDANTLEAVAQAALRRSYEANQIVLLEGEPSSGLFIVEEGWLKSVKTSPEGREQIMRVVGAGDVFNAIGIFASERNPGTVIALEASTVWLLPREKLLHLIDTYPVLGRAVIQTLAERIQQLMAQVEDLSLRSVEARLARLLLEESTDDTIHRQRWNTQAEMAARLGTVLDVLNRVLRRMVADGIITVERHQIQILDRERLKAIGNLET